MLFDPVLDDLRAVAHIAQVAVHALDEAVAAVAELKDRNALLPWLSSIAAGARHP